MELQRHLLFPDCLDKLANFVTDISNMVDQRPDSTHFTLSTEGLVLDLPSWSPKRGLFILRLAVQGWLGEGE